MSDLFFEFNYYSIYRLSEENKKNQIFWNKFGYLFMELLEIIKKDLIDSLMKIGLNKIKYIFFLKKKGKNGVSIKK